MNISSNYSVNKKSNTIPKIIIGAVLLGVFIFVLNLLNAPIKNFFFVISSPMEKQFFTAGESSAGFVSSIFKSGFMASENDKLKNENEKLLSEIILLQSINNANQAQSDVSLACQNKDFKLLMAGVIGLDGQDMVTINKGSADGLAEGMPVVSQQNVVFGKIDKVYKNFSLVMLISNKKSIINVKVQQSEVNGIVKGSGNMGITLDLVQVDSSLNVGDVLTISSIEKTFPKDLLVGKVISIEKNDQKPFQQAKVQPFFDLNNTENLFVITNYKQPK